MDGWMKVKAKESEKQVASRCAARGRTLTDSLRLRQGDLLVG